MTTTAAAPALPRSRCTAATAHAPHSWSELLDAPPGSAVVACPGVRFPAPDAVPCETCGADIVWITPAGDRDHAHPPADGHTARPETWCPVCDHTGTRTTVQEPWCDRTSCSHCGYTTTYMIGD